MLYLLATLEMTSYGENFFDKTTGIIEQLVLAVIFQHKANQNYIPRALETDFTQNAVTWDVSIDSGNSANLGTLNISVTLPTVPYDATILQDRTDISQRIASINPTAIDGLPVTTATDYEIKSFPVLNLPAYLEDFSSPTYQITNLLERRIMALSIQAIAVQSWVNRWNATAGEWIFRTYYPTAVGVPSLVAIEAKRDALLDELTNGIPLTAIATAPVFSLSSLVSSGDPSNAQELENFLGGDDPGNESTYVSGSLLDLLNSSNSGANAFGEPADSPASNLKSEEPTLSDC